MDDTVLKPYKVYVYGITCFGDLPLKLSPGAVLESKFVNTCSIV